MQFVAMGIASGKSAERMLREEEERVARGDEPTLNEAQKRYLRKTVEEGKHCEELMEKDLERRRQSAKQDTS